MVRSRLAKQLSPRQTQIRAVIFDLDGTLIRSAVNFTRLKRETILFLADKGLPAESFSAEMKSYDIMFLASELFRQRGLAENELTLLCKRIEEIWNRIELESVERATPIEGTNEALLRLREREVKIGVVTRGCRAYATAALKTTGLLDMVDIIVGRDDSTQAKPHPEPLIKALKALGIKAEEAVMVGDNVDDAQCAQGANVRFIGVKSTALVAETTRDLRCEALLKDLGELDGLLR